MENIILQIIKKYFNFSSDLSFSGMIKILHQNSDKFYAEILTAVMEEIDNGIKASKERKRNWSIIRIDTRTIRTVLGKITFKRTYYQNKNTKRYAYLLDEAVGLKPYQRLDDAIEGKILEFANLLSFENAGKFVSDYDTFSKQTVKNIIQKFSKKEDEKYEDLEIKRVVKNLYIEADEDHVALQKSNKNNVLNKIIYVHEGKVTECKNRKFLLNKKIFASNLKSTDDLWVQVYDYIHSSYDTTKIENIFILGDGARWIKTSLEWIENATYVLDEFHLNKAISVVSGGKRNKETYNKLKELVYSGNKIEFLKEAKILIEKDTLESSIKRKTQHMKYVKNQWKGIEANLEHKQKHQLGCSAEGHVSHILASRMSSRPQGWSREGLEGITQLRVAISNGATREDLIATLKKVNKKIYLEKNNKIKHIKRIKKAAMETLGNIPVLSAGKVNGLQCMMSGLR